MIFTGKDDGLNILGRSRTDVADVFRGDENHSGGISAVMNMFAPSATGLITERDKTLLEEYQKTLGDAANAGKNFDKIMKGASPNARKLAQSAEFATTDIKGLKTATTGATAAMVGARIAAIALNAALSWGIGLAIQGVIEGVTWLFSASERAAEEAERAAEEAAEKAQAAAESAKKLQDSLKDIEDYQKKVNDLSDTINNNNTSQAEALAARRELLSIQNELIEKYGLEQEVIDGITGALNGEKDALEGVKKSAAKDWLREHQEDVDTAEEYVTEDINGWAHWSGKNSRGETWSIEKSDFENAKSKGWTNYDTWDTWEDYLREPLEFMDRWLKDHSEYTKRGYVHKGSGEVIDTTEFAITGTREEVQTRYKQLYDDIVKYVEENNELLSSEQKNLYDDLIDGISKKLGELANDKTYQNNLETLNTAIENVLLSNENMSDAYVQYTEALDELKQAELENNPEAISQSIENLDSVYKSITDVISSKDSFDGVNKQTLLDYIEKLYFSETLDNARLKDYISKNDLSNILEKVGVKELTREGIEAIFTEFERAGDEALSKDQEEIKNAIDAYIEEYKNKTTDTIDYSGLLDAMVDLGYLRTDTKKGYDNFSLSDYSDELDKVRKQITTLKKAYDDFAKGELTQDKIFDLIADKENGFLELSNYINDIGTGIVTVAEDKIDNLFEKLGNIDIESLNDQELSSYNMFLNLLYDLKSGFSDLTLKQSQFKSEIKKTYEIIENLAKFKEDLTKNGKLSSSNLKTIEEDDTYSELKGITDPQKLSAAIEAFLTRAKKDYKALAESANEFSFNVLIRKAEEEIEKFEQLYDVDLSNWESLGEDKLKSWEGTSLQILSKQKKIINEFKKTYGVDLKEYKNMLEAKEALSDRFFISDAHKEIRKLIGNDLNYEPMSGKVYYTGGYLKKAQVTQKLKSLGMTWDDYINLLNGGKLPDTFTGYNELDKLAETLFGTVDNIMPNIDWDSLLDIGKATDETKQSLDWIERRLKRFAQTTKEVYADVEKYTNFSGKNSQLNKAIAAINNEIKANQDAYNAYINAANAVGLSDVYKSRVQNGTLSIESISDSDLRNKISQYQDLYDKALSCKDAVESLKATEKEYASQQLTNIENYYSARIKSIQTDESFYNSADVDNLNVRKNFSKLRELYKNEIIETEKEAGDLRGSLNSLYSRGLITPEAYEEQNDKIKQLNNNIRDTNKKLRDLADEELNYISSRANNRLDLLKGQSDLIASASEDPFNKKDKDYNSIRSNYRQQISIQEGLANDLQNRLDQAVKNSELEKFSSKWYEWTDSINDAKNNANNLRTSLHELYKEELDDIKSLREANIEFLDNDINAANSKRSNSDKKKYFDKEYEYLNSVAGLNKQKRAELVRERQEIAKKFKSALNAGLKEGSEIWNEFQNSLNAIDSQLMEVDGELNNISDSLRDLPVEKLAYFADMIGKIRDSINDIQSLHEAQGYDRTADEIYKVINSGTTQLVKLKEEIDLILSGMKNGKYGEVGSEDWNEALNNVFSLYSNIRQIQSDQEKEYDNLIDLQIEKLNKEKEEMAKQNSELEKRLVLEKAILALEKAKYQKNKLVYHEGLGFVYEADQNAIRDAQEELDKQYHQGVLDYFDKVVELLEEYKKNFNIYDYSGDKLSQGAYDDKNLIIDGVKYKSLKPSMGFLEGAMSNLDPSLSQLFASVFGKNAIIQKAEDYQNDVTKTLGIISSNFADLQKPNQVQFTISKDAIHLYGVNNSNELAQAIINYLPTQVVQDLYKK